MSKSTIMNPYLDNIDEWVKSENNQVVETKLLFEDEFNTKSFFSRSI